ncbi:condensation domain-containing protein [Actinophytocola sp.]|uniref:condensation domain-containing protein n=1 Tax=Actinophytocola sp. TaxID=1872138 RepID=UPI002D80653D|nr:condensation domain-containing protein [Actinophytocola sp.]HET9142325.1 condensation domain-containing protein [Actinophytocola sp.]
MVVDRILVPFEGDGSGVEHLTWSQMTLWQSIEQSGTSKTVPYVAELAPGTTVDDVAADLSFMMSRHQSLRTRLVFDGGPCPRQSCSRSGEVPLEIVDAGTADPAAVAEAVSERYQKADFQFETEWPVRMAVIRAAGALTHEVLVILHTAIDAYGLSALAADLAARDPATGAAGPVTCVQPLEQARKQASPAGQRHNTASLNYLERVLRTVTPSRFGDPKYPGDRVIHQITYHSPATLLAIRAVAGRSATNTSPVLLAAFAVGLARFTGVNPVLAMLTVSNRFRPGLAQSVSAQILLTPYLIDVADITLDQAVDRATQSALNAYKNAYYNPYEQDEVIERVQRERGEEIDLSCFYNDRRQQDRGGAGAPVTAEDIRAALPRATVHWTGEIHPPRRKIYFNVDEQPGVIEFLISADSRYFAPDDLAALCRGVEAVAVEAALDGSAPTRVRAAATV